MSPVDAQVHVRSGGMGPEPQADPVAGAPALFPAFLKLAGRKCLVVGAGPIGESKIQDLLPTGAAITVVAPHATETVQAWARTGRVEWHERSFQANDLETMFLAVVATSSPSLNESIYQEAQRRGVLCNVVDDPTHCDFYYPAVVRRGALQIAISTDGKSPALAQRLRKKLEAEYDSGYAGWLEQLGVSRQELFARAMDPEERRRLLHDLASAAGYNRFAATRTGARAPETPVNGEEQR